MYAFRYGCRSVLVNRSCQSERLEDEVACYPTVSCPKDAEVHRMEARAGAVLSVDKEDETMAGGRLDAVAVRPPSSDEADKISVATHSLNRPNTSIEAS